ncbi:MAG: transposase subunit [Firmicutes bacterium]|nr:transposase subunit [Bacillota bacterium]
MLMKHTLEQLTQLKLSGMVQAYRRQIEQPEMDVMSFEDRFSLLVDHECMVRQNRAMEKLLRKAKLRINACFEDIDYDPKRNIDRLLIQRLATCTWLQQKQNILVSGASGTGKTFMVCAIGNAACRQGYPVNYWRITRLIQEINASKADGSYGKLLNSLRKVNVLILDDFGIQPFTADEAREILEVIEDRNQIGSTVIASQFPVDKWYDILADPTLADAILDRIVHNSHQIVLEGDSMRKKQAKQMSDQQDSSFLSQT